MPMAVYEPHILSQARTSWRWARWILLTALVIAVGVATVAMLGWSSAIGRADQASAQAFAVRSQADQAAVLQQRLTTLQESLDESRTHERAIADQLAQTKSTLAQAAGSADELAAARQAVATARQTTADAEQARDAAQQRIAALDARLRTTGPAVVPVQQASNILAANAPPVIAPELPLPGLPAGARPRDYLVAAQQAIRAGQSGRAQAALERAETRLLNEAELTDKPGKPAKHPGVVEIERALDQLGRRNDKAAIQIVDRLLVQRH